MTFKSSSIRALSRGASTCMASKVRLLPSPERPEAECLPAVHKVKPSEVGEYKKAA